MSAARRDPRIAIIGGGIAGLAAAIALRRHGLDATVYEGAPSYPDVGVGFLVLPQGLAVLDTLGLGRQVRALGRRAVRATRLTADGRVLVDKPIPEHLCLRRCKLVASLRRALPDEAVRTGKRCVGLDRNGDGRITRVLFDDGDAAQADVFVGADGARSRMRRALFPEARLREPRVDELLCLVEMPDLNARLDRRLVKIVDPEGGLAVGMAAPDRRRVLWYVQFARDRAPGWVSGDSSAVASAEARAELAHDLVGHLPPPVPHLLEATDFSRSFLAPTTDLNLPQFFHRGNGVLIGDAAHLLVTLSSQGASCALEDALALARHLARGTATRSETGDGWLATVLEDFDRERRGPVEAHLSDGRAREDELLRPPPPPAMARPARVTRAADTHRGTPMLDTDLFADDRVDLETLRQRAYNHRWATLPEDVICLTAADPDFPPAAPIREAITAYVQGGPLCYGPPEGLPGFREAAARVMVERRGVPGMTAGRILATDSVASAMSVVARWALEPGDEALVFDPVDYLFKGSVEAAGGHAVYIPMDRATGAFDLDRVRALCTPRTRLLTICNPHNPLGLALDEDVLRGLCELAVEREMWILSDEIWCDVVFPPHRHVATASLSEEIAARTVTTHGFSKAFGLAGLRVGFIAAPTDEVFAGLLEVSNAESTAYGCSTISQVAAQAAYEHAWPWVDAFLGHLSVLRDLAVTRLDGMDGVSCRTPQATYLLFPDLSSFGISSEELVGHLREVGRVAVVPGSPRFFGPGAEGHVRIAFPTSRAVLEEGLDRVEAALGALKGA